VQPISLKDMPDVPEVVENGHTLEENAAKKGVHCAQASQLWSLADDTGLEVEALQGAPGVYSARYAGGHGDYKANNRKLLEELRGLPQRDRRATFRCVMALASPDGQLSLEEGRLNGIITEHPRGKNGFGYDSLFLVESRGKTLAELSSEEKNDLSHRALALQRMRKRIETVAGLSHCPRCGTEMEAWHCRILCHGCGYQIDCSDPFS
jgi:XTP/dITP diphosphohydrolase